MAQIEQLTIDLKQEEEEFVVKEKQLIQELNKYEVNFILYKNQFRWLHTQVGLYFMLL